MFASAASTSIEFWLDALDAASAMADAAKSLKVFVSYSRTDVEFADQLVLALQDRGFEPILDRHDMSGGENWRERLGKLILTK